MGGMSRPDIRQLQPEPVPAQDYEFLKKAGVAAIYGPGTNIPAAAAEILAFLRQRNQKRAAQPTRRPERSEAKPRDLFSRCRMRKPVVYIWRAILVGPCTSA